MSTAESQTLPENYKWQVLVIVMIGTLMAALDSSIVNVSIPAIMADFGVSVDDIEWVITGYMLSFATLMPLTAWLRDRIGHKFLYIASLFTFTLGSVLCGMAWNLPSLIVARVIQALGGGALTPSGMAMISEVFEPRERGKAMGLWGLGVIIGPAFGPTLGGYLTQVFGWRSIFLVNLPIGLLGMFFAWRLLVPDKPHAATAKPFDFWGFFFLSVFLVAFLLGISEGEDKGWTSTYIIICAILSFFGLWGFLLVEFLVPDPIMDLELFKSPVFSIAMLVTVVRSVALYGGVFLLPLFIQNQMGYDELQSGLMMLPGSLVIAVFMPFAGSISDRVGPRALSIVGLLAVAYFMYEYKDLNLDTTVWGIIQPTLIRGFGLGLLMAPIMATALNACPTHKSGMASSMLNLLQQVGGSLGIAILGTILNHRIHFHLSIIGPATHASNPALADSVRRVAQYARSIGYNHSSAMGVAHALVGGRVAQQASVSGFEDAFLVGAAIVLVAVIPCFFLPKSNMGHVDTSHAIME